MLKELAVFTDSSTTVGNLPCFDYQVTPATHTRLVVNELERQPELPGVLIMKQDICLGMVSRQKCLELLSRPFGGEVFLRRSILTLFQTLNINPTRLPAGIHIDQAVQIALSRPHDLIYEPLIIEQADQKPKLLDIHTLLLAQSRLLARANQMIEQQVQFGLALSDTLDIDQLLSLILRYVAQVVPYDWAGILLKKAEVLELVATQGRNVEIDQVTAYTVSQQEDICWQICHAQKPVCVTDVARWPGLQFINQTPEARSWMGVPLIHIGESIGLLVLISETADAFGPEQLALTQSLAGNSAIALQNARLYETARSHADELEQRVAERTRELATANARLIQLDRVKDQFVSNVSHELYTPLANVKLYLGLLDHGKPEKYDQYIQTLYRETARLQHIVEDLLEISRLDLQQAPIQLVPTDLNQLVGFLIVDRANLAAERDLFLTSSIKSDLQPALAQPMLVSQVMSQLMTNALNYTPKGGAVTLTTGYTSELEQDWVTVTIRDTGPGISAKDRPHIFERFYRGEAARNYVTPGTGLGLSICKQITDKLGGRLTLDSSPGQGAAFTIWLKSAKGYPSDCTASIFARSMNQVKQP
jgi:signal transduction histidine kinase